jgi:hypothetical protein
MAPQPGKFPVVFPTGAGEPTRDSFFSLSGSSLESITGDLTGRYEANSKYAEFSSYAGLDSGDLETTLVQGFYLGLAQQIVHAHMNMGLPQGDFSPVASSEIWNPAAVRSILSQMGEFQSETLGTRFLLAGYESTVAALVRAAQRIETKPPDVVAQTFWLPTMKEDPRTRFLVAKALANHMAPFGVQLEVEELSKHVFNELPDSWNVVKTLLGFADKPEPNPQDRFDFLFKKYPTGAKFLDGMTGSTDRVKALEDLGFKWPTPSVADLSFGMVAKTEFSPLADKLARVKATYARFFSIGSGLTNRSVAAGSLAQMSSVEDKRGVVVVKSRVAVSAPEYSLLACFPFSGIFSDPTPKNVVLTTSLNVSQRATEFVQLDWL